MLCIKDFANLREKPSFSSLDASELRSQSEREHVCQIGKADFWESENKFPRGGGSDHQSRRLTLMRTEGATPAASNDDGRLFFWSGAIQCNTILIFFRSEGGLS